MSARGLHVVGPFLHALLGAIPAACGSGPAAPALGVPSKLAFTVDPSMSGAGFPITPPVQVTVMDASGNTVPTATSSITMAIGANPGNGTLLGTTRVTAVNGVANFSGLAIDKVGDAYTLTASAPGLSGATSASLNILGTTHVSSARYNTCALLSNGAAFCWGWNWNGQLGDGTMTGQVACYGLRSCDASPTKVSGALTLSAVSSGEGFSCGLTSSGAAYCWGDNQYGELGNGSTTGPEQCSGPGRPCSTRPVRVAGGLTFVALSSGNLHTCALTGGGLAYCWGDNRYGQLGTGDVGPDSLPTPLTSGQTFAAMTTGGNHTCGLTASGLVYCWGDNSRGQLADSTVRMMTFASISAGESHTCGLTSKGSAYCWGDNVYGELGNGTSGGHTQSPVPVSGNRIFSSMTSGAGFSCGLTTAGAAYCWGDNLDGELGNGTTTGPEQCPLGPCSTTPVAVSGAFTFTRLSTGPSAVHTCSLTVDLVYCWGDNSWGELGNGTTTSTATPVCACQTALATGFSTPNGPTGSLSAAKRSVGQRN
jgi:alpha-tubulin suppressor-like RCC1 family protein